MQAENVFYIKLSDLIIEMHSDFDYTKRYCENYITDSCDVPDIVAEASREQIKAEKLAGGQNLPDEYCENTCLYRSIAEQLPHFDRVVFHGAAIEVNGKGYVFTAPSGTGKTTHIKLWMEKFGDKVKVVNGDKPILRLRDDGVAISSTPWMGKEKLGCKTEVMLGSSVLLKRSTENKMSRIAPNQCFGELVRQFYLPQENTSKLKTLDVIDRMLKNVPIYLLECDMSTDAAELSYKTLTDEQ